MSWLFPAFMGAAGLIGLPIVLHLLRRKPQQIIAFPTLRFLGASAVRETNRHRIRRWITLALRCLIIGLLAAAFARPFFAVKSETAGQAVVIAIDNSYSMQASGRWKTLLEWASAQVSALGPKDQAGILLINPKPSWLVPMTQNVSTVRASLASLEPGFYKTNNDPALRVAGQTLERLPANLRRVVWVGDGQKLGWTNVNFGVPLPPGVKIEFPPISPPARRQAAIVNAQLSTRGSGLFLNASIRQYVPATDSRTVTVSLAGRILGSQKIELGAAKLASISIPVPPESAAGVTVALDPDDLPADDRAYATTEMGRPREVLLAARKEAVGESADYLAHAIEAVNGPGLQPFHHSPLPTDRWPSEAVALLRGEPPFQSPAVERLDEFLNAGGRAWCWVDGSAAQVAWLKKQGIEAKALPAREQPYRMRDFDVDHPLLELLGQKSLLPLLAVEFRSPMGLSASQLEPLASWEDQSTAIGQIAIGRGILILCGSGADQRASNWPLQSSFVPFVHQALLWLAQGREQARAWRVGDAIPLPAEPGTWTVIDSPRTGPPIPAQNAVSPAAPGLYRFTSPRESRDFAVNLSTEESDLTPWPTPDDWRKLESKNPADTASTTAPAVNISNREAERQQKLWWWLIALVAIFVVAELGIANRTAL